MRRNTLILNAVHMKDTELRRERDAAVYATYLRGLREQHFSNMNEAAEWIRHQQAPKFYMSARSLVNYIGAISRGKCPTNLHANTQEKVDVLYAMYRQFLEENPGCKLPREQICEILVDMPAPKFYIRNEYILMILLKERNRHKELMSKRYNR